MTDVGVDFHLDMERQAGRLSISAYVATAAPRVLTWRLVAVSRTAGGRSEVVQSGATDGLTRSAVGSIGMQAHSQGCVILTVSEGGREIGRKAQSIGDGDAAPGDCV
ncbi:MAG TPA: hypothetical protein VLJ13_03465 [Brevundimonas sp.]|nr:hypothetical protein [Brevundimonas sp.]